MSSRITTVNDNVIVVKESIEEIKTLYSRGERGDTRDTLELTEIQTKGGETTEVPVMIARDHIVSFREVVNG